MPTEERQQRRTVLQGRNCVLLAGADMAQVTWSQSQLSPHRFKKNLTFEALKYQMQTDRVRF